MVRFKNRYLVLEIDTHYGVLPESATETALMQDIKNAIRETLGEMALAKLVTSLKIVRFNPKVRLAIVRVQRESARTLRAAIFFVDQCCGVEARLRVARLSGTIRRSEEFVRNSLMAAKAPSILN